MDRDLSAGDILENPVIGSWLAALVVFGLKTIDGDDNIQPFIFAPFRRHNAESAGNDLRMNAARFDLGNQLFEFPVTDERIPTHQRHMERSMLVKESENTRD